MSMEADPLTETPPGERTRKQEAQQLEMLRNILTGADVPISLAPAIGVRNRQVPMGIRECQILLEDQDQPSRIRALAALSLGRIDTPEAEEILIRNIQIPENDVLSASMTALGRIGGVRALEAIVKVRPYVTGPAAARADFAAVLISYRLRLKGHQLTVPSHGEFLEPGSGSVNPLKTHGPVEAEARFCLQSLAAQPFGVEFSDKVLHQVSCGRSHHMLVLNGAFEGRHGVRKLREGNALLGAVATRSPDIDTYSIAFLVFTSPGDEIDRLHIWINRATGESAFAGTARLEHDTVKFQIAALAGPGAFSLRVNGTFDGSAFTFTEALCGLSVQQPLVPIRIGKLTR
jgi:hypothetical protein